jgi:uncharacterized membrane protein YhaH (DUF805 family)
MIRFGQTIVEVRVADDAALIALAALYGVSLVASLIALAVIVRRAGYSAWWILVAPVPLLNVVMLCVFAAARWPLLRALEESGERPTGFEEPPPPPPLPPPAP